jgi:hypothetical protein
MDLFGVVIGEAADLGIGDGAIFAKGMQGARRNTEELHDLVGFEPFFWSFVGAGLEHGVDRPEKVFLEVVEIAFGQELYAGDGHIECRGWGQIIFHLAVGGFVKGISLMRMRLQIFSSDLVTN